MKAYFRRWFVRSGAQREEVATAVIQEAPALSDSSVSRLRRSDLVERRAYLLWNAEGRIPGRDVYYWLRAEEEIAAELGERQVS
jgi:hypothetical protein